MTIGLYKNAGTCGVYALVDPATDAVRYVGASINIEARYRSHCNGGVTSQAAKEAWIKGLKSRGLAPILRILRVCEPALLDDAEVREIVLWRSAGQADFNVMNARSMGRPSPYSRRKDEIKCLKTEIDRLNRELAKFASGEAGVPKLQKITAPCAPRAPYEANGAGAACPICPTCRKTWGGGA